MTVQNITITINNQKQSIENYSLIGGRNGIGTKGRPLHIEAKENVNYLLTNTDTQFAPENIATKRVGNNLYIAFEGADINSPDLIIDNYFAINGDSNSSADQANLIIGQHENGKYYPYVPESASKEDAISQLAENHQAGQALGGNELPPVWAFNPWWLAALIPLAVGGIAIGNSGGGGSNNPNKPSKPVPGVEPIETHPPEAADDQATTKENTPVVIDLLANDSDKDGDLLISSVEVKSEPTQGSVTIDPATGHAIYTPNPGAHGTDTFTYVVYDQKGNVSNEATVTIDISTTPVAEADQATTQENTPVVIDLVANDRDKESGFDYYDNPTTSGLNPASVEVTREPTQGSVTIDKTTGEATYTPNTGAHGTDTFTYVVYDKDGNPSEPATVTVEISANPVAVDDNAKTQQETPVVIDLVNNDSDKDGDLDPTTVEVTGKPTQGKVVIDPVTGEATYTPNKDAHGTDTFTYIVYDKEGNPSEPATITVEISANPVAVDDSAKTQQETPVVIDLVSNDSDKDGDLDPSTIEVTGEPTQGKVVIDPITGEATYTPNKDAHGTDTFTYIVYDKEGNPSEPATVTVEISANPVAVDDSAKTQQETPVVIDLVGNDSDKDGDLLVSSVEVKTQPTQGSVTIDKATGKATYTPNKDAHGTDTFTYVVYDKEGNPSEPATVTVEISANPIAVDDSAKTQQETPVVIDLVSNDSDKDGDLLVSSVEVTSQPTQGSVTIDKATGKATYTPNKDAHGTDTFTYIVYDKEGNPSEPATVTVEISANPVAVDDSAKTQQETPVVIDLVSNDGDKDGDLLVSSVEVKTQPTQGSVTIDKATGKATYTPNKDAHGTDTFTYVVYDKEGNPSEPATVTVEISANPVAVDDSVTTTENIPVVVDLLTNDDDKDGDLDPTTVEVTGKPTQGKVVIDPITGEATYTPNAGSHGTDTFTYIVYDKEGNPSEPATVTVEISANPVAVDDSAKTQQETPVVIDLVSNDSDRDGDLDPATVEVTGEPAQGKVVIDPVTGEATYTPNKDAHGTDTFTYIVYDKEGNPSEPATVTVEISANPVAVDDSTETQQETPVVIDLVSNDGDKDGDLLVSSVEVKTQPTQGSVTVDANGKATYTPNAGSHGTDTFTYVVYDKEGNPSEPATVTVEISANPVAVDDSAKTQQETPVVIDLVGNDSDKDGDLDPTTVEVTGKPTQGKVVIDPVTGEATYTPNKDAHGTDTFTYIVYDKEGNPSEPATVTVEISANPVAVDDSAKTQQETPVVIDLVSNDSDKDGDLDPSTVDVTGKPTQGKVVIDPITGEATYTPNKDAHGTDTFTYVVYDKDGNPSEPATVTVEISANPVAGDDNVTTTENTPIVVDLLTNDSDKDGDLDPTTVEVTGKPTQGKVVIDPVTGEATYTPNKDAYGTDTFTYVVYDKEGNPSEPATVTVEISANPVAVDDSANTKENTAVEIDLVANDSDKDGDLLVSSVEVKTQPTQGSVTVDANGKATYTPNTGAYGTDTFTYIVYDKEGNPSEPATVTVEISANPVAVDDSAKTQQETPVVIDLVSNDSDKDGDLLVSSVEVKTQPMQGSVTVDANGKATYTPNTGSHGTDTFTYVVYDKEGNPSEPATVTVEISANPVAVDDSAKTQQETPVVIDLVGNDSDRDGDLDPATVEVTGEPTQGKVVIDPITGEATYTPNKDAHGTDTFTYVVYDKEGNPSEPATVTVEISANPVAVDDQATTQQGKPVIIDVLENDTDKDNDLDPTSLIIIDKPSKGDFTIDATGKVIYTPNPGESGSDTFTYQIYDKEKNISNEATVKVEISASETDKVTVSESGLANGSNVNLADTIANGEFIISNPDNKSIEDLNIQLVKPEGKLTSNGELIVWGEHPQELIGKTESGETIISIKLTETKSENGEVSVKYDVELKGPVDHAPATDDAIIDFSVKSETDIVKGEILIKDDSPISTDIAVAVEAAAENTFYANVVISLDFSTSMYGKDSGIFKDGKQISRYDAAIDAMESLLNSYQERLNSADNGDVRVSINGFAQSAVSLGNTNAHPSDKPFWGTIEEAQAIVKGLKDFSLRPDWHKIGVDTNYDAALQQLVDIYNSQNKFEDRGPLQEAGVNNTLYFISDGTPNVNNSERDNSGKTGEGIQAESPDHYIPGDQRTDIGENHWKEFLENNSIRSIAIGIGPDMANGKTYLAPISYDGAKGIDNDQNDLVVLENMSNLADILDKYIPNDRTIEFNFSQDKDGQKTTSYGADGMGSTTIEVDGKSYTYDVDSNQITTAGESTSKWVDLGNGQLSINTKAGGILLISLGEENYGNFTYKPGFKRPSDITEEKFTLTLTDKDGDSNQSSVVIDLKNVTASEQTTKTFVSDYENLDLFSPESLMSFSEKSDYNDSPFSYNSHSMLPALDILQTEQSAVI